MSLDTDGQIHTSKFERTYTFSSFRDSTGHTLRITFLQTLRMFTFSLNTLSLAAQQRTTHCKFPRLATLLGGCCDLNSAMYLDMEQGNEANRLTSELRPALMRPEEHCMKAAADPGQTII